MPSGELLVPQIHLTESSSNDDDGLNLDSLPVSDMYTYLSGISARDLWILYYFGDERTNNHPYATAMNTESCPKLVKYWSALNVLMKALSRVSIERFERPLTVRTDVNRSEVEYHIYFEEACRFMMELENKITKKEMWSQDATDTAAAKTLSNRWKTKVVGIIGKVRQGGTDILGDAIVEARREAVVCPTEIVPVTARPRRKRKGVNVDEMPTTTTDPVTITSTVCNAINSLFSFK